MTLLCPTIFMDNWLARFAKPALVKEHVYRYPHRTDFFMSPISLDDMAKFMVAALGRDDLIGRRIRVAGPETLNPPKIAEALSAGMGVEIRHEYMTPRAFGEYLYTFMGVGESGISKDDYGSYIESYYEFNMTSPERPFAYDVAETLPLLPVDGLETFREWAPARIGPAWTTPSARPPDECREHRERGRPDRAVAEAVRRGLRLDLRWGRGEVGQVLTVGVQRRSRPRPPGTAISCSTRFL
jgi:hypothetical protein